MSPIKEIQERYRELGRLRMGEQDGKRPVRLDTWRLTSPSKTLLEHAAALWGGDVEVWDNAPTEGEQFELTTEVAALPVKVPPQDIDSSTWLELWSGSGRKRMCDGVTEQLTGKPCICATKEKRDCKPTTQVKVILPDIPDMGTWRLVTHGWNAAAELTQTVKMLNWIGPNTIHDASFRIEARTSKTEDEDGKPQTHHFVVPVLELPFTFNDLASSAPATITAGRSGRVGLPGAPPALPADATFEHDREQDWGAPVAPPEVSGAEPYGEGGTVPESISPDDAGGGDATVTPPSSPGDGLELDDEPAPTWMWKDATAAKLTGARAFKAARIAVEKGELPGPMPTSQSSITSRQLHELIERLGEKT